MRKADLEHCSFSLPDGLFVLVADDSVLAFCVAGASLDFEG
jgi:hypothetical protein